MIVVKFGGTSVQDDKAIAQAERIIRGRLRERPIVIVSALAGVTDMLVRLSHSAATGDVECALRDLRQLRCRHLVLLDRLIRGEVARGTRIIVRQLCGALEEMLRGIAALGELTPRTTDHILGTGELLSSHIVAAALRACGIGSSWVDSRDCIVTDDSYSNAIPLIEETEVRVREHLWPVLQAGQVPVMAGFIGATLEGIPTTLGRGGSDYSAALVGASLNAKHIEIWTDVEGMMTTDPRLCPQAQRIETIGFDEAAELAYFGAKVLHPATLIPALQKNIPVYVLNSRNPDSQGTCVCGTAAPNRNTFRAIAAKRDVIVVNVRSRRALGANSFLRAVFEQLEHHSCRADLVATSEVSLSVALQPAGTFEQLLRDLKRIGEVDVEANKAIICLVGQDIRGRVGIAARVFETIAAANINVHMISQGASEINVGFVIADADVPQAVQRLHRCFFEEPGPISLVGGAQLAVAAGAQSNQERAEVS